MNSTKKNMLKKIAKKLIGESNIVYFKDKWNTGKNEGLRKKRTAFYSDLVGSGDLCFDVGANYGNRIEVLLDIGCKVVAVEPQQECCNFLKKKFGSSIEIINKGLGAQAGKMEFFKSNVSTLSTFSKDWITAVQKSGRFREYNWNKKIIVEMTTLDKLLEQYGVPQFIKIDVEGYELEVLKGLSSPVKYISFEYAVPEQVEKTVACIKHIQLLAQNKKPECNYSVGESMLWASDSWFSCSELIDLIRTEKFINTGFGDIYIRTA